MGFVKTGFSALGKLFIATALAGAFLVGMVGVVYMSLKGEEVQIPEVVGKDFYESEKELAALGLKVKKIASRYSEEKPNTILEQRPRAGSAAKTGLMVSVIISQQNPEGTEAPAEIKKKSEDEKDIEEIEDLISDEPTKKKDSKTADKKRPTTTRDTIKKKDDKNDEDKADAKDGDKTDSSDKKATDDKTDKKKTDDKSADTKKPTEKTPPKTVPPPPKLPTPKPNAPDTRDRRVP